MSKPFYVDIHCHPTLRAMNSRPVNGSRNPWEKTSNETFESRISRWANRQSREISKESQCNYYAVADGNIRVVFDSLYPVEKGFLNFRKLPAAVMGKTGAEQVFRTVTGIEQATLYRLRENVQYFPELLEQYEFLLSHQGDSPDGRYCYQLVNSYAEMEQLHIEKPNCVAVVVNIEGAHALGCGTEESMSLSTRKHKLKLTQNIETVKSWDYSPFSINLAHHFWNQLCGHTRSFKPPIYSALNQKNGLNTGITELGWHVIQELHTRNNGKRILIDTKHMSVAARLEYYSFIERYNYMNKGDQIPIICSHTGVNGFSSLESSVVKKDKGRKTRGSYFHNWGINLSSEELRIIHKSKGIVGIMLDKGLLGSPSTLAKIAAIQDDEIRKDGFSELILRNIFYVMESIGEKTAWDLLSIGSDYDGLITHVDCYENATRFINLEADLVSFLERKKYKQELWFGYEPHEMIRKIMGTNAMDFLKNNF